VVGRLLVERGMTIACAESLTGGSVGVRLSTAAGASDYFMGSAVTYTAEAKRKVLGVRKETIDGPGVVSEECAVEMAQGARRLYESDVALALTGVAGPEPHDGKPPGTVCLGLSAEDRDESRCFRAPGDREQVRRWAEQAGLDMVRRYLEGSPLPAEPGSATDAVTA
jgi:PncC family amidohydrolase